MKKTFKKILALTLICALSVLSLPTAFANDVLYEKYSIFDLDLGAIDNYIVLRLYDEEVYNVFVNYALLKNSQVQGVYSKMAETLTGDEDEAEVLALFEELTYAEALASVNKGASADQLISSAPYLFESMGIDPDAYKALNNREELLAPLKGKTFESIEAHAESVKALLPEDAVQSPASSKFTDIYDAELAKAVDYLLNAGIVSGKSDSEFCPEDNVKREEFSKMLVLALGLYDEAATSEFTDVTKADWFYTYVSSAVAAGLIEGYGEAFGAGDFITRQDVATIVYRAFADAFEEGGAENIGYADEADISDYAIDAVRALSEAKIMGEVGENRFAPDEYATRAQVAEIIYSIMTGAVKGE